LRRARGLLSVILVLSLSAIAAGESPEPGSDELASAVCAEAPHELLVRIWRGVRLDRSGQIQMLPQEPNFVDGGLTHAGPWDYVQDVPMLWYGPGYVKPGRYDRPVTLADIAPTAGRLLDFDFPAPDGRELTEALVPADERPLPRLVVTLVWDSAGMDVLDEWPKDWPYLRQLAKDGAWFEHATVGASPSNTPVGHSIIGTGSFPNRNGFVDEFLWLNEKLQKPNANGPAFLLTPTLADLYDFAMHNEPKIGGVATLAAHIAMEGHGAMWGGSDKDIAITREKEFSEKGGEEDVTWNLTSSMAPFYRLPGYANKVGGFEQDVRRLDQADGALDERWRDNSIFALKEGFDTPARTPYQTRLIQEVVEREDFGDDDVPDLLYLNYKAIDTIGHLFTANGVEMSDAVRYQDEALRELVTFLNREVGRGRWVMVIAADHGTNRDPDVSGAFRIGLNELEGQIQKNFDDPDGVPLLLKVRPTEIWLNEQELADNGHTLVELSEFIMGLTQTDVPKPDQPVRDPSEKVFAAAFPSSILGRLPCLSEAGGSSS